ncbi:hypothetical protein SARC_07977, partial [Sphaeroforma arctica JP610]
NSRNDYNSGRGGRYDENDDDVRSRRTSNRSYGSGHRGAARGPTDVFSDDDGDGDRFSSPRDAGDHGHDYGDPYAGAFVGYQGYVRDEWGSRGPNHVIAGSFGVDRSEENRIKISCNRKEISIKRASTGKEIDTIQYLEIQKIDHKHERTNDGDGADNILSLSLKDGSRFVINSPQTPEIKDEIMDYIKRSKSVHVGSYKRNY